MKNRTQRLDYRAARAFEGVLIFGIGIILLVIGEFVGLFCRK